MPKKTSLEKRDRFLGLEKVIGDNIGDFFKSGNAIARALCEIRDKRLYMFTHARWIDYVKDRWGISQYTANAMIRRHRELVNPRRKRLEAKQGAAAKASKASEDSGDKEAERAKAEPDPDLEEIEKEQESEAEVESEVEPDDGSAVDSTGRPIKSDEHRAVFNQAGEIESVLADIRGIRRRLRELAELPVGYFLRKHLKDVDHDLRNAINVVDFSLPYAVSTSKLSEANDDYAEAGFVPKGHWDDLPDYLKGE